MTDSGPAGRQLSFDLGQRAALCREDFFVAPCNTEAVDWVDLWPDWPGPALVLCGPAGSGKTHLAAVWCERSGALPVTAETAAGAAAEVSPDAPNRLVDPFGAIGDEEALLHLYNRVAECGGHLLLTMAVPPARMDFALADLASRLRAAPLAAIGEPDEALLGAVMIKLFADRQLLVPPDVLSYLLPRIERSFAAVRGLVERIDARALAEKRALTVPFVRTVMERPGTG